MEPAAILLALVLTGKITHEEANILRAALLNQKVLTTTRELQAQIEEILGRKL